MSLTFDLLVDYIKRSPSFYKTGIDVFIQVYCNNSFLKSIRISTSSPIWISREELSRKLFEGYSHNLLFNYAFVNSKTDILLENKEENMISQFSSLTL